MLWTCEKNGCDMWETRRDILDMLGMCSEHIEDMLGICKVRSKETVHFL